MRDSPPRRLRLRSRLLLAPTARAAGYDVTEKSIDQLRADLAAGWVTSFELVRAYEARIAVVDRRTHAVLALNPHAEADARTADAARRAGRDGGPLAGAPRCC